MVLVNRVLALGTFQLDGEIHLGLVHVIIFAESLKAGGKHLNPQLP